MALLREYALGLNTASSAPPSQRHGTVLAENDTDEKSRWVGCFICFLSLVYIVGRGSGIRIAANFANAKRPCGSPSRSSTPSVSFGSGMSQQSDFITDGENHTSERG